MTPVGEQALESLWMVQRLAPKRKLDSGAFEVATKSSLVTWRTTHRSWSLLNLKMDLHWRFFRLIKSIEWLDQGFLLNLIYVMKVFIEEFFFYLIYLIKVFLQPFRPTDDPTLMILKLASVGDWVHIYVCHQNDQSYLIMSAHIFWRLNSYAYKKINST